MTDLESQAAPFHPMVYQIRIKGHLSSQWSDWFDGLNVDLEEDGNTLLTGPVVDQAALHGLLRKVRDLGMPLLSVNSNLGHARPVRFFSNLTGLDQIRMFK